MPRSEITLMTSVFENYDKRQNPCNVAAELSIELAQKVQKDDRIPDWMKAAVINKCCVLALTSHIALKAQDIQKPSRRPDTYRGYVKQLRETMLPNITSEETRENVQNVLENLDKTLKPFAQCTERRV